MNECTGSDNVEESSKSFPEPYQNTGHDNLQQHDKSGGDLMNTSKN